MQILDDQEHKKNIEIHIKLAETINSAFSLKNWKPVTFAEIFDSVKQSN